MAQAYRAYLKYAQRTGDRFPMQRNVFTRMVLRISESMASTLDPPRSPVKDWMARVVDDTSAVRKTTRMCLVAPKPDGVSDGAWASECVAAFEQSLNDYLGYEPRSPGDGKSGSKEGECHAVTRARDTDSKHWRGLSRCHAVTQASKCVRVGVREEMVWVCACFSIGVARNSVTA